MQFLSEVWNSVLAEMREDYSETLMELWFNELHLSYLSDDVAVISTKQKFKRDFLESKYTSVIHDYLTRVGFDVRIIFIATDEKRARRSISASSDLPETVRKERKARAAQKLPSRSLTHRQILQNLTDETRHFSKRALTAE